MTDENNQIKFFLYENWARTKTGQHTVHLMHPTSYVKRSLISTLVKVLFRVLTVCSCIVAMQMHNVTVEILKAQVVVQAEEGVAAIPVRREEYLGIATDIKYV